MSYPNYPGGQPGYPGGQPGYPVAQPGYPNYGNSPPAYSPEDGNHLDFDNAFSDKAIRQGFIRKVYSILSIQLIVSFGTVLLFTHK